jgi:hypothetical protein
MQFQESRYSHAVGLARATRSSKKDYKHGDQVTSVLRRLLKYNQSFKVVVGCVESYWLSLVPKVTDYSFVNS